MRVGQSAIVHGDAVEAGDTERLGVGCGLLDVSIRFEPDSSSLMQNNHLAPSHDWIILRVADNGCGLPDQMHEQIFEPFISTKITGTGLGLPICRRIAEAHGGQITAANRPCGGAEMEIRLPCVADIPDAMSVNNTGSKHSDVSY